MCRVLKVLPLATEIIVLCILAASCGSGSSTAQYRVVQAIPDAPVNLDISVGGKNVFSNVAFRTTEPTYAYQSVSSGSNPIEVFPTGSTTPIINSSSLNLIAGTQSTVLLTGLYAAPSAFLLRDNNTAPPSGQAEIRIVNAAPSALANLDIYLVAPGVDITERAPNISPLPFAQQSVYQNLPVGKSGYAQIVVIVTKSGDPNKAQYVNQLYTLSGGQIRTLVLVDVPGGGSVSVTPLEMNDLN